MVIFKFYIRFKGQRLTTWANGRSLADAFDNVIRVYPDCTYLNHYEAPPRA